MTDLSSYQLFACSKATIKDTSKDDSDPTNIQYLTQCESVVVSFDLVKRKYANSIGLSEESATSVDAITRLDDHLAFIEFKNGAVNNRSIKDKLRDSLLIFSDITATTITYTRDSVDLIVVYNIDKNPLPNQVSNQVLQGAFSRDYIGNYISALAKDELIRFDLEKYKTLYFREVHTYTKEQFEQYLSVHQIENLAV